jgi:protein TonB
MKNALLLFFLLSSHIDLLSQSDSTFIMDAIPPSDIVDDEVYTMAEVMPQFPDGSQAMQDFVHQNFVYPQSCIENSIQGKIFVDFIVEKDGKTTGHQVVKPIPGGRALSEEAIRTCKLLEGFSPGLENGQPVRVRMTVPIDCVLSNQRKKKK